ncbi:unnamed protein product [Staurois parvus]|uniref:Secreted protein n=1 Tax=Staurois parvus TaxID=386267 RepID=A0ABN9ECJ6_9NEOB|nr:unnamed protein product [Staurois parvus]
MCIPVCFCCVLVHSSAFRTVLCRKNAGCSTFFSLQLERTGTASTFMKYDTDNHITYFLCILDAEKKHTETHVA